MITTLAENEVVAIEDIGDYIDVRYDMTTIGFTYDDFILFAEAIAEAAAKAAEFGQDSEPNCKIAIDAPLRIM